MVGVCRTVVFVYRAVRFRDCQQRYADRVGVRDRCVKAGVFRGFGWRAFLRRYSLLDGTLPTRWSRVAAGGGLRCADDCAGSRDFVLVCTGFAACSLKGGLRGDRSG